jgi:uncharacterized protein (DUF924 family)
MVTADEVLDFWFERPAQDEAAFRKKVQRWFMGGPAGDEEIRKRFERDVELALEGKHDDWANSPRGLLALVLLLDQFTRSIYRDTARAFAGDQRAQSLTARAFDSGFDRELDWEQKQFLAIPFLHAENAALQARFLEIMARLQSEAPELHKKAYDTGLEQGRKYQDIIGRFGRFPHRNAFLGRQSTPEEEAFLVDWAAKAAPRGVREPAKSE